MSNEKTVNRIDVGKRAGIVGIFANILLAIGKLIVGIISSSVSIIADALNNFSDCISSVVTMIGFKVAQKPADSDHPYGHARFEYIASLIVAILVLFVGFELIKSSVEKIIEPTAINFSVIVVIILAVSVVVKFMLYLYNSALAKKINSNALKATSVDCRNDSIMTSCVLIATIIEHYSNFKIDGYMGVLIALFILYSGIKLVKETVSPILGEKHDEKLKSQIVEKLKEYPFVLGYHDLMMHDYGPGITFCTIHFEIDKNEDPLVIHEHIDRFEREFLDMGVTMTVHYDPVVTDSPELNIQKQAIDSVLMKKDERLSIHDFRSITCDGFTKVFFDLPLPCEYKKQTHEIISLCEDALNSLDMGVFKVEITFDSPDFN